MNAPSHLKIDQSQLEKQSKMADGLLNSVTWQPKTDKAEKFALTKAIGRDIRFLSEKTSEEKVSLMGISKDVSGTDLLLSEGINHCLQTVWQAFRLGSHVAELYEDYSGLRALMDMNKTGLLPSDLKGEFQQKQETQSAIALFVTAYYVLWDLSSYRRDKVDGINLEFEGIPEVFLLDPVRAFRCMTFHYVKSLQLELVQNQYDFLKMTQLFFQAMVSEIRNRLGALKFTEVFTDKKYQLEGTEFRIDGFSADIGPTVSIVQFNRVRADEIVGNRGPKRKANIMVDRATAFDPATKRNPMKDLGGLPILRAGFGIPGTGKGLQISYTSTRFEERCEIIGLRYRFHPMPPAMVSSFQGQSTERMRDYLSVLQDPGAIVYGVIDDAEQHFQNRTRQNNSEGSQGIMSAFLPAIEGPTAIWHGNAVLELFTNLLEIIDPAVLSRMQEKFSIDGAVNWVDFMDQDFNWWSRYQKMDPKFVNMKIPDPSIYVPLVAQKLLTSLSQTYEVGQEPNDQRILSIYHRVMKQYSVEEHGFFAELFVQVKKVFPLFGSRDVKNIQRLIDDRVLDFDFPEVWLENPEVFYRQDYERKRVMIVDLMLENMQHISFATIRLQETLRYLDTLVLIQEQGKERAIKEAMERMEINVSAQKRLAGRIAEEQ